MDKRPTGRSRSGLFGDFLENLLIPEEIQKAARAKAARIKVAGPAASVDPEELAWQRAAEALRQEKENDQKQGRTRKTNLQKSSAERPAPKRDNSARPAERAKRTERAKQADSEVRKKKPAPVADAAKSDNRFVKFLRTKPANVRDALILAEIIGKPVGLR